MIPYTDDSEFFAIHNGNILKKRQYNLIKSNLEEKLDEQELFRQIGALCENDDELKKLVRFAHYFIDFYRSTTGLVLPDDYDAEDIVLTVIGKNLDGSRGQQFDPSKGSISSWLKKQIESEIKNKSRWDRSKLERPIPVDGEGEYQEEQLERWAEAVRSASGSPPHDQEVVLLSEEAAEEFWDNLYEIVQDDQDLEKLVELLENGCDFTPRNLATELGWTVERVNNAKKRLRRRVSASYFRREQ